MEQLTSQQEADLIRRLPGDPDSFRPLYRHYQPRVYAYVAYRVGAAADAEDVVAEIFKRVVTHIGRFTYRGDGSFSAWVFHIAHNEVNRFYRRNRADRQPVGLDDLPELRSGFPPLELVVQRKEQLATLRELIGRLSPRRQEIVTMKFFGELRNQEIAAVLNLDERTVASHLTRALDDLRRLYQYTELQKGVGQHEP